MKITKDKRKKFLSKHKQKKRKQVRKYVNAQSKMLNEFNSDNSWMYAYVCPEDYPQEFFNSKTLDQLCNYERNTSLNFTIAKKFHNTNNRKILKKLFKQQQPVYWQAVLADISMPKKANEQGELLLNHVINKAYDPQDFSIGFTQKTSQIDYHLWLPINNILYFGKSPQYFSIGDVITGKSWVTKYHYKDNREQYGLGKTIITNCGIPLINNYYADLSEIPTIKAISPTFISNYNREEDWVLKLSYSSQYLSVLKRYKKINLSTLKYLSGHPIAQYKRNIHDNFHIRLHKNNEYSSFGDLANDLIKRSK